MKKVTTFVDRLSQLVKIKNITYEKLAEMSGIHKGLVSRYVNGKVDPRAENVQKIAEALDVSPIWLIGYDISMEDHKEYNIKKEITRKLDDLSSEQLEKLNQMIDLMFSK